ncbi:MAG: hypothetical protein HPY65_06425 [Syntrophaceae bacterium]|nr:hypothetical protein [Syntrophaceae bacterium]
MILYAVADVHGRKENLERIEAVVRERKPDILVAAGDVATRRNAALVLERLNALSIPVLVVRGNMDPPDFDGDVAGYRNIRSLHRSEVVTGGVPFAGISGTIPVPFRTRISFREDRELTELKLRVRRETVLVAHPPPLGVLDRAFGLLHAGSPGLRDFVRQTEPRLLICGHIHEAAGAERMGRTLVVNAAMGRRGGGVLIRLGADGDMQLEWP